MVCQTRRSDARAKRMARSAWGAHLIDLSMAIQGAVSGLFACLWLIALWIASPICFGLRVNRESLADRLLGLVVLGTAIPFVLALFGLLSWAGCYVLVIAICMLRGRSLQWRRVLWNGDRPIVWPLLAVGVAAGISLLRPPLDGDTLAYHLPNALTWSNFHSLWQTGTRYWWYPGGSELFASGMVAVGGRWAVGLSGSVVAALVCSRLTEWGRILGVSPLVAGLVASAFLMTPIAAVQMGDLQNDLWVAALIIECLWALRTSNVAAIIPRSLMSIVKPTGFFYSALVSPATRAGMIASAIAWIPLLIWILRDVILWRSAIIQPVSTAVANVVSTTIAGNGVEGLRTLAGALWAAGIPTILLFVLPFIGISQALVRREAFVALACHLIFFIEPFGFSGSVVQLSTGSSLRFDLPALALATLIALGLSRYNAKLAIAIATIALLVGTATMISTYWNDALTRVVIPVLGVIVVVCLATPRAYRSIVVVPIACLLVGACSSSAAGRASSFYNALIRSYDGEPTSAFTWLQRRGVSAVVTLDVRGGLIGMVSPHTMVYDANDVGYCNEARTLNAALVVGTDVDRPAALHYQRVASARKCGTILFEDKAMLIVQPTDRPADDLNSQLRAHPSRIGSSIAASSADRLPRQYSHLDSRSKNNSTALPAAGLCSCSRRRDMACCLSDLRLRQVARR
jgi:hypothetical protein